LKDTEWRGVVRQLLALRLLAVEGDYGTLVLTEESGEVLGRRREVMMRREPERVRSSSRSSGGKKAAVDLPPEVAPVFERLRAWRGAVAKEQGVPAYVIFHDATLRQIATELPSSLAELGRISGVGENKLAKYGDGVLEALAAE
jgi:ATP-dependent DNA helicase RecQ